MTDRSAIREIDGGAATRDADLESFRSELRAYCYKMLGSVFEADDAVQETLVRAWKGFDRFEGRSALRSWLYTIATNVCLDQLDGRRRRARPMDLQAAGPPSGHLETLGEEHWIEPVPDGMVVPTDGDPAEIAVARDSVRLAFVAALQHLPPRQRAVLILREVLRWKAADVAALLDDSVASVNSALQRARATIGSMETDRPVDPLDEVQRKMLDRYVDAFQRYDMAALTSLIHEDATQSMPPFSLWLSGRQDILDFWVGPGKGCTGSRLIPTVANGLPAFGQYRPKPEGGGYEPWALQIVHIREGRVAEFSFFLDTARFFPLFGLPLEPDF